jgi:hypothetical protein
MKGKSLGEALKLFRARRFPDVIRMLEPEVFRYRESIDYFKLLGFSCLHAGDLGGAFSYLSRAHQLDHDDVSAVLGIAAIHFRRAENESALKRWLEVLEVQPGNPIARRGLDFLRKGFTADQLQEFIDSGKLKLLYPPLPSRGRGTAALIIALCMLAVAGIGYLGFSLSKPAAPSRPGVGAIEIPPGGGSVIDAGTDYPFILTEREVRQVFQKAKSELLVFHDNRATVEINRLLLSNAAPSIKERARMLKGFITQASFDTLKDGFPYATVAAQPALYDGCSVRWRGKIANYKVGKDAIGFDLLVGYDQEKELEGIVPVTLPFAVDLANGMALEVLGQVMVKDKALSLLGISLHRLSAQ